jgi:hypothetical protein
VVLSAQGRRGFARGARRGESGDEQGRRVSAVTRVGIVCVALLAAGPSLGAPPVPHLSETGAGQPALIGTACMRAKPALRHVMLTGAARFCCGPNGGCATPLASTVIEVPVASGHT